MDRIRSFLESEGRDRHALCGVELRCPEPHTMDGFIEFNREYRELLREWDLLEGEANPIARTNVAPVIDAPTESVVFGFSYTAPCNHQRSTFVVAGGGELPGELDAAHIVRAGETDEDAMLAKAQCVVKIMQDRLAALGDDALLTSINVYTAHALRRLLTDVVLPGIPAAARLGAHWHFARPPVQQIEFEMDMRGVLQERTVDLR